MKFSSREDIGVPIEQLFLELCDFETLSRKAMHHGADVQRVDTRSTLGTGMRWKVAFMLRGRKRELGIELVHFDKPNELVFEAKSSELGGRFTVELIALSRSRTRMIVAIEMKPLSVSARLLMQSLKLAKKTLTKRFKLRVRNYANSLEEQIQDLA